MINPAEVRTHNAKMLENKKAKYFPAIEAERQHIERYVDNQLLYGNGVIDIGTFLSNFDFMFRNAEINRIHPKDLENDLRYCLAMWIKENYTKIGWFYGEQRNRYNMVSLVSLYA